MESVPRLGAPVHGDAEEVEDGGGGEELRVEWWWWRDVGGLAKESE